MHAARADGHAPPGVVLDPEFAFWNVLCQPRAFLLGGLDHPPVNLWSGSLVRGKRSAGPDLLESRSAWSGCCPRPPPAEKLREKLYSSSVMPPTATAAAFPWWKHQERRIPCATVFHRPSGKALVSDALNPWPGPRSPLRPLRQNAGPTDRPTRLGHSSHCQPSLTGFIIFSVAPKHLFSRLSLHRATRVFRSSPRLNWLPWRGGPGGGARRGFTRRCCGVASMRHIALAEWF